MLPKSTTTAVCLCVAITALGAPAFAQSQSDPSAQAKPAPKRVAISAKEMSSKRLDHAHPVYPTLARENHIQGSVVVNAIISTTGEVSETKIISSPDFDKVETLKSHRKILEKSLKQTQILIETLDKTITHLRGKEFMNLDEIFHGFDAEKQKYYEDFLADSGVSQEVINSSKNDIKNWTKAQWMETKLVGDQIHSELVAAIKNHLSPASPEVQTIIKKHYQLTKKLWTPNRETYIGLSQLYASHPDFVKFYDDIHPELLKFLMEAMRIFAENELA